MTENIDRALKQIYGFLSQTYSKSEIGAITQELKKIIPFDESLYINNVSEISYEEMQNCLLSLNEKGEKRKSNGVYYTPNDVVKFIYTNAIKALYGNIKPSNLHVQDLNGIPYKSFCYGKTVFDPTCGTGEFLLVALSIKLDLIDLHQDIVNGKDLAAVLRTIFGNDINAESILITKLRLFLYVLHRYDVDRIQGITASFDERFGTYDFINLNPANVKSHFDIIIGNPPYVEDTKCDTEPIIKYGNVYANVLENATSSLAKNGVMGFIIPLSYVATPRMRRIRNVMRNKLKEQYILSYCDRPDCLFPAVHQKLCILIGKERGDIINSKFYTGNYQFWYKEERDHLFTDASAVLNKYVREDFIPKIGTELDLSIYAKVTEKKELLSSLLNQGEYSLYLNMRAAFWIKAFRSSHSSGEYKQFFCKTEEQANLCFCVLNSSLFWWYWICVSDCWHLTNKELNSFTVPIGGASAEVSKLAKMLEMKLEKTKLYVGTKQTEYEYKHKECVKEIHEIDDVICKMYGLTEEETIYIKNFAYRYRVSGGVVK